VVHLFRGKSWAGFGGQFWRAITLSRALRLGQSCRSSRTSLKKFSILIPVIMLPLGAWLGYRTFGDRSGPEILAAIGAIPEMSVALAIGCAAASYVCLSLFDTLAVRAIGRDLPYRNIALTSFVSLGIGHTVGVAVMSSGALRYRFYSGFGLRAGEVGKIVVLCGLTVGLGLLGLAGLILIVRPDLGLGALGLSPLAARGIGALCLVLDAAYIVVAWRKREPLSIRGHEIRLPSVRIACAQVAIGTVNFAFVAATLHQLLAGAAQYSEAVAAYVLGNMASLVSHVPGGLGVLEFMISKLVSHGNVIGALIAFRIVYFLVPLILASTLLLISEAVRWRKR
jgi:uncharacterized membrane protein YbhN (UPF0104 family)